MNPGDSVWWQTDATGSRTGRFIKIVKRGRNSGLAQIEPTDGIPRKTVYIKPEHVTLPEPTSTAVMPKTQLSLSY